ncbi:HAD family hydrolase [Luteolibacter sp. SL250]|uniref:HAD family hydrolase n=1 Tax=Luteolibacter sp. SL250 TaxID=2995170 RepID=UPI00226F8AE1|nr:HAD family hydrolase [Luteolibacter sp. SL250]WAC19742.1 HAD family hydrolase [Luteolibacter sp. SL250]
MAGYLIWDFDDTLARRDGRWSGALAQAAATEGVAVDAAALKPYLREGFPWHLPETVRVDEAAEAWWARLELLFITALESGAGLAHEAAVRAADRVKAIYCEPTGWEVFADVVPALERLSAAGWRHVILSNHVPELADLVAALGLTPHFEIIFTSGLTGVEKPHPSAFRMVRQHARDDVRIVMIGDRWVADVGGASAAGLEAVLVRKHHPEARWFCEDLGGLAEVLDAIGRGNFEEK